jgi:UDP-N-acetylmuramoyl-tripeptide--D-alanyl-D-alanine ligase
MILGDMFEMGDFAKEEHKKIIDLVENSNITAIFIGEEFYNNKNSNNIYCKNTEEAKELILKNPPMDSTILLKGSRGMKLESLKDIL